MFPERAFYPIYLLISSLKADFLRYQPVTVGFLEGVVQVVRRELRHCECFRRRSP